MTNLRDRRVHTPHGLSAEHTRCPSFLSAALYLLAMAAFFDASIARAADPQPYKVDIASTGNRVFDSALKATSQLEALRKTVPTAPFGLIARARGDIDRLKTVLESFGYYDGSVTITINGQTLDEPKLGETLGALPKGKDAQCKVTFTLGPLYHTGRIEIDGSVPDFARGELALASGAPAVAGDILAAGARLLTTLENNGFAFAKVDAPVAYQDPENHVLNVSFHVVTGSRVHIGTIQFEGLKRVHEGLLRRRLLVHTGEPYSAIAIEKARKDLLTLGIFDAVSTRLAEAADPAGRVGVTFQMRERLRHAVSLNTGYSSDLGGSAGVTWTDRNVRGNAEQLVLSASVINLGGTATTGAGYDTSAKYIIPDFAHRDQQLQFAVGAIKQSLQAYDQTAETSGVTLSRKFSSEWSANIGLSAVHETVIQESITRVYSLFSVPFGVLYDSTGLSSPLIDPTHGQRASLSIAPTLSRGQPNTTFYVTQASIAEYLDLHRIFRTEPGRSVIAVRALVANAYGAGGIDEEVNGQEVRVPDLPPDQRFYAGGSGTVRGYRYQSVGLQFPDGNPVGATAMSAFNLEYRQRFGTDWGAAFFADAGETSDSLSPLAGILHSRRCSSSEPLEGTSPVPGNATCWAVGVGAGARYFTSIGALRLDIALPTYRRPGDDRFEVYIGLGEAF